VRVTRGRHTIGALGLRVDRRVPVGTKQLPTHTSDVAESTARVVRWYFENVYGRAEGPGVLPFYCDQKIVGGFAVTPRDLLNENDAAYFRLFVALSMFQARRDVLIMEQQRTMGRDGVRVLTTARAMKMAIAGSQCPKVASAEAFDLECDVSKRGGRVDCGFRPGALCHVKDATIALNRTGDMGKLPTSAWLHLWHGTGLSSMRATVLEQVASPTKRAALLVERISRVYRVGRKLATMFVSALSTPGLAPGLSPWHPDIDGNELVVVDTNVTRAIRGLTGNRVAENYDARARWVRRRAADIDLRTIRTDLPRYSPRLVQQALYHYLSRSNRISQSDSCRQRAVHCASCIPVICPFSAARAFGRDGLTGDA
jgi:hypothetical protein